MKGILVNSQNKALVVNGNALELKPPYDSRVTYLETDGLAYIDTGVNLRAVCVANMGLEFKQVPTNIFVPYGIWWSSASGPRNQMAYISGGVWTDLNTSYTQTTGVSGTVAADTPYRITAVSKATYADDNTNFFLTRHVDSGAGQLEPYVQTRYLRIAQNNAYAIDTYPVRVGSVGYLYDSVHRRLIPNAGGGAFQIGDDTPFTLSAINGQVSTGRQGMAIYGDIMARANDGTDLKFYNITQVGNLSTLATVVLPVSTHNNCLQFAPTLEAGQTLPYLYAAALSPYECRVYDISASYAITLVQTITIDVQGITGGCNILIGDDGNIWAAYLDSSSHYNFLKFRKVLVSEGDVTLTESDLLDRWAGAESFPYSSYVWQGMMVKRGFVWFLFGTTGSGQHRGVAIYDTVTHEHRATWDLSYYNVEYEDLDFWGDSILIGSYQAYIFQVTYDYI